MTCANWTLSLFAAVIFVATMWPNIIGAVASKWVVLILALLTILVAWIMVDCRCCKTKKK